MKKIFLILVITFAAIFAPMAQNVKTIVVKGDSTVIVDSGDTTLIVSSLVGKTLDKVQAAINDHLDDTVIGSYVEQDLADIAAGSVDVDKESETLLMERLKMNNEDSKSTKLAVVMSIGIIALSLLIFSIAAMYFYYIHRRAKYRVLERAIESNYPIPPTLFGKSQTVVVKEVVRGVAMPGEAASAATNNPAKKTEVFTPIVNVHAYKSAITLAIVGLVLMLFFGACGANPMVALSSLLLFLGIGRGVLIYLDQRYNMPYQGVTPPPMPQQPQQTEQSQQTEQTPNDK